MRKRARRRLVGAVALVIVAVAALPLLLDADPPVASQTPQVSIPPTPADSAAQRPPGQPDAQRSDTAQAAAVPTEPLMPEPAATAPLLPGQAGQVDEAGPGADSPAAGPDPAPAVQAIAPDTPPSRGPESALQTDRKTVADGKGAYVVQLIATTSPEKARDLERRLEQLKFPAYTEKTPDGAKTRVRVGPFARQEAAESARQRLLQLGFDPGKVARRGE